MADQKRLKKARFVVRRHTRWRDRTELTAVTKATTDMIGVLQWPGKLHSFLSLCPRALSYVCPTEGREEFGFRTHLEGYKPYGPSEETSNLSTRPSLTRLLLGLKSLVSIKMVTHLLITGSLFSFGRLLLVRRGFVTSLLNCFLITPWNQKCINLRAIIDYKPSHWFVFSLCTVTLTNVIWSF